MNGMIEELAEIAVADIIRQNTRRGADAQRQAKAARLLAQPGDFVGCIGSSSNRDGRGGVAMFLARRDARMWIGLYTGGSGMSNAAWGWVRSYARPWNGGLAYGDARRAARAERAERAEMRERARQWDRMRLWAEAMKHQAGGGVYDWMVKRGCLALPGTPGGTLYW